MLYPKKAMVPPGGYFFIERVDGAEVRIEADNVENLAAKLLRYRLDNNRPAGNPMDEVAAAICVPYPHFCAEQESALFVEGRAPAQSMHLSRRVSDWTARLWNLGTKNFVRDAEAARRAEICRQCPLNVTFRDGGCGSCLDSIDRLTFVWLRQRETAVDKYLFGCRATGANNRAAVHADKLPDMTGEQKAALASRCWRKTQ